MFLVDVLNEVCVACGTDVVHLWTKLDEGATERRFGSNCGRRRPPSTKSAKQSCRSFAAGDRVRFVEVARDYRCEGSSGPGWVDTGALGSSGEGQTLEGLLRFAQSIKDDVCIT